MIPRLLPLENNDLELQCIEEWISEFWKPGDDAYFWPPSKMSKNFGNYFIGIKKGGKQETTVRFRVGKGQVVAGIRDFYCHAEHRNDVFIDDEGMVKGNLKKRQEMTIDWRIATVPRMDCWLLSGVDGGLGCETRLHKLGFLIKNCSESKAINDFEALNNLLEQMINQSRCGQLGKMVLEMIDNELLKYGLDLSMFYASLGT